MIKPSSALLGAVITVVIIASGIVLIAFTFDNGGSTNTNTGNSNTGNTNGTVASADSDWLYDRGAMTDEVQKQGSGLGSLFSTATSVPTSVGVASESAIGFSTGGAKDVNNFRANIKNNYLPLPTDITYEGLFYDYYFDTGATQECTKLFCPSYTTAVSKDPLSREDEYFMAVGLNSGMKQSDFERKKLNLAIVLDISGSMGSAFDSYYYDRYGNYIELDEDEVESKKSKMQVANESIVALLEHLNPEDRFGVVVFDDQGYKAKNMTLVSDTDMDDIIENILDLQEDGGTNMEAGMKLGTAFYADYSNADQSEYENRIIFLTDAMPNTGATSDESLLGMTSSNADDNIYTTFIGIGVDFNTELVEQITKIQGANYYSVHSANEFSEQMDENFDYMVTPLVFDLELKLEATGYEIEKVYGSPEADEATGEIMKVNTLFPSRTEGGETRGGLVLLQLRKTTDNATLKLTTSYEDRNGKKDGESATINFTTEEVDEYSNTGIQKGILLSRYANLMKNWMVDERSYYDHPDPWEPAVTYEQGIIIPEPITGSEWERESLPLYVSLEYQKLFSSFYKHFNEQAAEINDDDLAQETEILKLLMDYSDVEIDD